MKTFSTGDIAKYCDVNLRTVIRWIAKGDLEGFKLPGRGNNRVTEEAFLAFLKRYNMPIPDELNDIQIQPMNSAVTTAVNPNGVLIVDDEPQVARAIKRVLKTAGYDTSMASDGFRAGSKLVRERPRLMTLDLSMPGLDGFEVIRFVRETEDISATKILVISALEEEQLKRSVACGADRYLQKPFSNAALLAAVANLLAQSELHQGSQAQAQVQASSAS